MIEKIFSVDLMAVRKLFGNAIDSATSHKGLGGMVDLFNEGNRFFQTYLGTDMSGFWVCIIIAGVGLVVLCIVKEVVLRRGAL